MSRPRLQMRVTSAFLERTMPDRRALSRPQADLVLTGT